MAEASPAGLLAGSGAGRRAPTERKLVADSLLTYGTELAHAVLLFLNGVIVARWLGPEGRGIYAVVILVPLTLFTVGHLGLFQGLVHNSVKDPDGEGRRVVNVAVASFAAAILMGGVGAAIFARPPVEELESTSPWMIGLALAALLPLYVNNWARALVLGRDDLFKRNVLRLIEPIAFLAVAVVLVVALDWGLAGALAAWAASLWVTAIAGGAFLWRPAVAAGLRPDLARLAADLKFGLKAYGAAISTFLLYRFDQFIVAYFLPAAEVGYFAVAQTLIMTMSILPAAVQASFLPKVTARYYAEGERENMTPVVVRMMTILSLGMGLLAALGVYPFIWLFYGRDFLPSAAAFLVMLPGVTFLASLSVLHSALQARSAQKWVSISAAVGAVVNVSLALVAIPALGIVGAALVSSFAYAVMVSIGLWAFLRIDRHLTVKDLLLPRREDLARLGTSLRGQLRWVAARLPRRGLQAQ